VIIPQSPTIVYHAAPARRKFGPFWTGGGSLPARPSKQAAPIDSANRLEALLLFARGIDFGGGVSNMDSDKEVIEIARPATAGIAKERCSGYPRTLRAVQGHDARVARVIAASGRLAPH
jgi:hypothetical protein